MFTVKYSCLVFAISSPVSAEENPYHPELVGDDDMVIFEVLNMFSLTYDYFSLSSFVHRSEIPYRHSKMNHIQGRY